MVSMQGSPAMLFNQASELTPCASLTRISWGLFGSMDFRIISQGLGFEGSKLGQPNHDGS